MKQHYVPRFYLNYFCDDRIQNGKYLWRYKCGESQAIKSATKRIASIPMMNMNWQCLVSLGGGQFITSDRPAAIFNPKLQNTVRGAGLLQKHAEIFFPVSPNKGLCLSRNDGPDIIELTPDYVHEFNKRTLYLCYREVYASREDRQVGGLSASLPSRE